MKVLIVDDSRAHRNFARSALRTVPGIAVEEADSGFEAFRVLARTSFDVIVTDINMPDINGLELVRFVRKSARHAGTGIVVISTQSTERMREKMADLGVDRFVAKPFAPESLADAVTAICSAAEEKGDR